MILNQLTDARAAVDVRDYFEQVVWVRERRFDLRQVELTVLVAHRAGRYPKRPVVKGADERVGFGSQRRLSELLGSPKAHVRRQSADNGKPVAVARAADVPLAIDMFRYMGWFITNPRKAPGRPLLGSHSDRRGRKDNVALPNSQALPPYRQSFRIRPRT